METGEQIVELPWHRTARHCLRFTQRPLLLVGPPGSGKAVIVLARKFLNAIYHMLKNNWMFADFANFLLAEAS